MRVLVTLEATGLLESRKQWWRDNRPATADLFDDEFAAAVSLISQRPALFRVWKRIRTREIRRVLMEKSACHLYYEIDGEAGIVKIISAWGAARGQSPRI